MIVRREAGCLLLILADPCDIPCYWPFWRCRFPKAHSTFGSNPGRRATRLVGGVVSRWADYLVRHLRLGFQTIDSVVTKCHNQHTKQAENEEQGTSPETETPIDTTRDEQHELFEQGL